MKAEKRGTYDVRCGEWEIGELREYGRWFFETERFRQKELIGSVGFAGCVEGEGWGKAWDV